jgi:hypothetical protein
MITRNMPRKRRIWSVGIYCRHENAVLLAYRDVIGWTPVEGYIIGQDTPLEAARRLLVELGWPKVIFPSIHKVTDAPPGLLLYEEHDDEEGVLHRSFAFVAEVPTPKITLGGYSGAMWVRSVAELPMGCPTRVLTTMPFALTAGRERPSPS